MTPKDRLTALAVTFGIVTEGLTVAQLQEALDANAGYQAFLAKEKDFAQVSAAKETAEAKAIALEGNLTKAREEIASLTEELGQANGTIESLIAEAATAGATGDDPAKVIYTDANGKRYEITQPTFRYKGKVYQSADAVEEHREVLQELLNAKAFIFKQV